VLKTVLHLLGLSSLDNLDKLIDVDVFDRVAAFAHHSSLKKLTELYLCFKKIGVR
jgi:hypothetical protein